MGGDHKLAWGDCHVSTVVGTVVVVDHKLAWGDCHVSTVVTGFIVITEALGIPVCPWTTSSCSGSQGLSKFCAGLELIWKGLHTLDGPGDWAIGLHTR